MVWYRSGAGGSASLIRGEINNNNNNKKKIDNNNVIKQIQQNSIKDNKVHVMETKLMYYAKPKLYYRGRNSETPISGGTRKPDPEARALI